ncbi:MAG: hypothetical protein JW820_12445 [Spirochaetales bacterium]|nr:hypothetical protein [Spirochaetales bacterium]
MSGGVLRRELVGLASDWEPDRGFLEKVEHLLHVRGHGTYLVWPGNLQETLEAVRRGTLLFSFVLDRASNTSAEFDALTTVLEAAGVPFLDRPRAMVWAADKATMHLEFLQAGLEVPHTVILDPLSQRVDLPEAAAQLSVLGIPFVVKPANTTGGGIGVSDQAASWEDIQEVRHLYPEDKYLVQERVRPLEADGRRFWFRVFYACGHGFCCWWDDRSHVYAEVSEEERELYSLQPLEAVLPSIAGICRLNLFSSEVVKTREGRIVVVDYVNETPDLRPQSGFPDGVPDRVVDRIVEAVSAHIERTLEGSS